MIDKKQILLLKACKPLKVKLKVKKKENIKFLNTFLSTAEFRVRRKRQGFTQHIFHR